MSPLSVPIHLANAKPYCIVILTPYLSTTAIRTFNPILPVPKTSFIFNMQNSSSISFCHSPICGKINSSINYLNSLKDIWLSKFLSIFLKISWIYFCDSLYPKVDNKDSISDGSMLPLLSLSFCLNISYNYFSKSFGRYSTTIDVILSYTLKANLKFIIETSSFSFGLRKSNILSKFCSLNVELISRHFFTN